MNDIELSIITVNYNGLEDTCALIDTIAFNDHLEVIVVDNGSRSDEAQIIAQRYPAVRVIQSETNLGFAGGNNLGIKAARGKFLFLVNNDTVFAPFHVQPLIDRLNSSPLVAIVCPKIRFAWDDRPIQYAGFTPLSPVTLRNRSIGYNEPDSGQYDTAHPTPYAHGAAMMIKRQVLERIGCLPECYFLYYEELDWSLMFTREGYEIWYEPASTIFHKESQATGSDSPLKTYYICRNRLIFAKRNITGLQRLAAYAYLTLLVAPKDIVTALCRKRPDLARAALKGLRDFYLPSNSRL